MLLALTKNPPWKYTIRNLGEKIVEKETPWPPDPEAVLLRIEMLLLFTSSLLLIRLLRRIRCFLKFDQAFGIVYMDRT
jgi:hypothetical protein